MFVTELGIVMLVKAVHPLKAETLISVNEEGKQILSKFVQLYAAKFPIETISTLSEQLSST